MKRGKTVTKINSQNYLKAQQQNFKTIFFKKRKKQKLFDFSSQCGPSHQLLQTVINGASPAPVLDQNTQSAAPQSWSKCSGKITKCANCKEFRR